MLTGQQYLDSLNDGRTTYLHGRRVDDLLAEPAFAVPAQAIAQGYDNCYSDADDAVNPYIFAPRSIGEMRARTDVLTGMDLSLIHI